MTLLQIHALAKGAVIKPGDGLLPLGGVFLRQRRGLQVVVFNEIVGQRVGKLAHAIHVQVDVDAIVVVFKVVVLRGVHVHKGYSEGLHVFPGHGGIAFVMAPAGIVGALGHHQLDAVFVAQFLDLGEIRFCRLADGFLIEHGEGAVAVVAGVAEQGHTALVVGVELVLREVRHVLMGKIRAVVVAQERENIAGKCHRTAGRGAVVFRHHSRFAAGRLPCEGDLVQRERHIVQGESVVLLPVAGVGLLHEEQRLHHNDLGLLPCQCVLDKVIGGGHLLVGTGEVVTGDAVPLIHQHRAEGRVHVARAQQQHVNGVFRLLIKAGGLPLVLIVVPLGVVDQRQSRQRHGKEQQKGNAFQNLFYDLHVTPLLRSRRR